MHPDQPPPYQPGPPPYGYPPAPPKTSFWKTGAGVAVGIVGGFVLLGILCFGGCAALVGVGVKEQVTAGEPTVTVTGCDINASNPYLKSATARFTITNTTKRAQMFVVKIEVQDFSGTRYGDGSAIVSTLAPGATEQGSTTILISGPGGERCVVTDIN